jgi:hypothetical protein
MHVSEIGLCEGWRRKDKLFRFVLGNSFYLDDKIIFP